MFELMTKDLRTSLTSLLPFCSDNAPWDRLRFEVRDDEALISTTTQYSTAIARVTANVWDDAARGRVFEIDATSARKLLAVHILAKGRGNDVHSAQQVMFELVDNDSALRTQDTSGLFPGSESLVVPLCEQDGVDDVIAVTGGRVHRLAESLDRRVDVPRADAPLAMSLHQFDKAVKGFGYPAVVRFSPDRRSLVVTVGASFLGVTSSHDVRDDMSVEDATALEAWPLWLETLPSQQRDDLDFTGPEPSAAAADSTGSVDVAAVHAVADRIAAGMREKGFDVGVVKGEPS